jgi:MFS family permease
LLIATDLETSYATVLLPAFLLMGGGLGCASVASTALGTSALDATEQGLATGLLNAAAQIGTVLGLAVLVSLAAARAGAGGSKAAQVAGYHWAFAGAAALALAGALAVLLVLSSSETRQEAGRSLSAAGG